jgi:hypothetical protein
MKEPAFGVLLLCVFPRVSEVGPGGAKSSEINDHQCIILEQGWGAHVLNTYLLHELSVPPDHRQTVHACKITTWCHYLWL